LTLWLKFKTKDNQDLTRFFSKSADPSTTVDAFIQLLVSEEELRVRPSHVTLRWPRCLPDALDASKEAQATLLDKPWQTLSDVGIEDGHVLLAYTSAAQGGSAEGAPWLRAPLALLGARCHARAPRAPCEPSEPRAASPPG
jgi:hypothetical protein